MKLRTRILIIAGAILGPVLLVAAFFLTGISATVLSKMCEGKDLSGGYLMPDNLTEIWDNNNGRSAVGEFVADWAYDHDFILVFQWAGDKPEERTDGYDTSVYDRDNRLRLFKAQNNPAFWIIDKRQSKTYGPMDMKAYLDKRNELGVPENLRLKLKLEI